MRIARHISELIGNTPLVQLNSVVPPGAGTVAAKIEYLNPGGSSKDRIAVKMIDAAEASGELKPGGTIVEPTSGNTGVGLALVAQERGYRCIFVCPDKVGKDKIDVLRAYGAEVLRGAIRSVHRGQHEACHALNMTPLTRMRRIILPQALLAAIPPGTNLLIELLKNTSLVSLITLSDLAFRARQLDQATLMTLEIFGLALVIYFVLAQTINFAMRRLEQRLARGRMRGGLS